MSFKTRFGFLNRKVAAKSDAGFSPIDTKDLELAFRDLQTNRHDSYTIVFTPEQAEIVIASVTKFSELFVGQTKDQQESARKLVAKLKIISTQGTNDLTK